MTLSAAYSTHLNDYADYLDIPFSFAFQPIIHAARQEAVAYEALLRGIAGESSERVIERVAANNRFQFDQACRVKAIQLAARIDLQVDLQLNCLADALENVSTLAEVTRDAAAHFEFPVDRVVLEFSGSESFSTPEQFASVRTIGRFFGFRVAADNFGAGVSGLRLLARFQPDQVKLNRNLIDGIHESRAQQAIVRGILTTCEVLESQVVATGVESQAEYEWLREAGIELFQGFYFAAPGFESAPEVARELLVS